MHNTQDSTISICCFIHCARFVVTYRPTKNCFLSCCITMSIYVVWRYGLAHCLNMIIIISRRRRRHLHRHHSRRRHHHHQVTIYFEILQSSTYKIIKYDYTQRLYTYTARIIIRLSIGFLIFWLCSLWRYPTFVSTTHFLEMWRKQNSRGKIGVCKIGFKSGSIRTGRVWDD